MGWASGSSLMADVIDAIEDNENDKVAMFIALILAFENADCDTLDECLAISPSFDIAYETLYPNEDD